MDNKEQLFIELDRQLLQDVQTYGAEGWIKHMAEDIVVAQVNYMNVYAGKELVSNNLEVHYETPGIYYTWEPSNFDISNDLSLVSYLAKFYFEEIINDKVLEFEGYYTFTWKLVNGGYKLAKMIAAWKT